MKRQSDIVSQEQRPKNFSENFIFSTNLTHIANSTTEPYTTETISPKLNTTKIFLKSTYRPKITTMKLNVSTAKNNVHESKIFDTISRNNKKLSGQDSGKTLKLTSVSNQPQTQIFEKQKSSNLLDLLAKDAEAFERIIV